MSGCEHDFVDAGLRYHHPDDRPMSGGGAYRRVYVRVWRCRRCLDVRAERVESPGDWRDENSYGPVRYGATPPTSAEIAAVLAAK